MPVISVRFNDEEYEALKGYAASNGIPMSKAIKDAFFEKFEDQCDIEAFDHAYVEYLKDPKTYTSEEVAKMLGIR